jgi:hypothetical protein
MKKMALVFCFLGIALATVRSGVGLGITGAARNRLNAMDKSAARGPDYETKINSAGWADSPFISRDGQRLYFMYSRWNYLTMQIEGRDRAGLQKNDINPYDESDIYVATKRTNGTWGVPVRLGFNTEKGDSSGMELDDGDVFVWIKPIDGNGMPDIVVSARSALGAWSAPVSISSNINTNFIEDNPHMDPTGTAIWFTSDRPGGAGGKDIWFSQKTSGVWSAPVNLGAPINTAADEDQFWVQPGAPTPQVYFNRDSQIYRTTWTGVSFEPPLLVDLGLSFIGEASITDDGQSLYFASGGTAPARIQIMTATSLGGGLWDTPVPVD